MRLRRFDLAVTCVCLALLSYFAWHASKGPRGFAYRDGLEVEEAGLTDRHAGVETQRLALEHRVALLRPESIDPDMLDELARLQLEMVAPNDVVVLQPAQIPQGNP